MPFSDYQEDYLIIKEIIDENLITLDIIGQILDKRLANDRISGYLVGDKISYADLYGVKLFGIALYTLLGEPYLDKSIPILLNGLKEFLIINFSEVNIKI